MRTAIKKQVEESYPFLPELHDRIGECMDTDSRVVVAVMGNKGVGKSRFSRLIRKYGCGDLKPKEVAVIDDNVMRVRIVFGLAWRFTHRTMALDEFEPFDPYLKRKKVVFCVHSDPSIRLAKADVVLRLFTDETTRLERLKQRNGEEEGMRRFTASQSYDPTPPIPFRFVVDGFV
ncbi:MAG: hypothetical protein WD342_06420 [Verrucomicrobiales bacterium]